MPAEEEPGNIKSFMWELNSNDDMRELQDTLVYLGVGSSVWRYPEGLGRMEIPDTKIRTNPSVLIPTYGRRVRTTTMDDSVLINIELMPEGS